MSADLPSAWPAFLGLVGFDPSDYGDDFAHVYDDLYDGQSDPAQTVEYLASMGICPGDRVLEMGAGTGRLSLPLAGSGLRVTALDVSQRMLDKLQSKVPDGLKIETVLCDMASAGELREQAGTFKCVLIAFNSILHLETEAEQLATLRGAFELLEGEGRLVVELNRLDSLPTSDSPRFEVRDSTADSAVIRYSWIDSTGLLRGAHLDFSNGTCEIRRFSHRSLTPSSLVEMASSIGFRLVYASTGWDDLGQIGVGDDWPAANAVLTFAP